MGHFFLSDHKNSLKEAEEESSQEHTLVLMEPSSLHQIG